MRHALPELVANYGSSQPVLNTKLGYVLRCDPARVQVLHGAAQAFPILGQLLDTSDAAVPSPTFGEYARIFPSAAHYQDAPGIEWSSLAEAAAHSRVCIVVNPNTPTGTTLPTRDIHSLARRHPETLFWVDESFVAFSSEVSLVELLEDEPLDNVLVLTSLSKCLGVPGLRLGYLYSTDTELVAKVGAVLPVWNLSAPAEFLLELLIKFRPTYADSLRQTAEDREAFRCQLADLPIVVDVHPSGADFLLVGLGGEAEQAAEVRNRLLGDHNIEVKNVTERFPDRAPRLRIAVRLPEENAILLGALLQVSSDLSTPEVNLSGRA
jgi:histidinol-phosphate/aromatic aminotransferase/cobyric acid decarboxylase-like protein